MVRLSLCLAIALWAALPTVGSAGCISEAEFEAQQPNHNAYSHTLPKGDGGAQVTIYLKGTAFSESPDARFLEVTRKGDCIISIDALTRVELDKRHQLYGSWSELEEMASNDNEGMAGENSDYAVTEDDMFPFLSLESDTYAIRTIYSGPIAKPDFKRRDKKFATYRTRITQGMKGGVNFSGEYALTEIGCGTGCSIAILSNIRTGEQFEFPIGGEESGPLSLKFAADSSLLITSHRNLNSCVLESLLFNGNQWVTLAKPVVGEADLCYDDIDENIARYKKQSGLSFETSSGSSHKPNVGKIGSTGRVQDGDAAPGRGKYEDINLSALRDLYEIYMSVEACYRARRGQPEFYISDSEMNEAQAAFKKNEDIILARNKSINVKEVANDAAKENMLFAAVMVGSQLRYDNKMRNGCRQFLALFPPDLDKTVAREILPSAGTPNIGSGLIIPQDPRFQ